jgi:hypothetical protein
MTRPCNLLRIVCLELDPGGCSETAQSEGRYAEQSRGCPTPCSIPLIMRSLESSQLRLSQHTVARAAFAVAFYRRKLTPPIYFIKGWQRSSQSRADAPAESLSAVAGQLLANIARQIERSLRKLTQAGAICTAPGAPSRSRAAQRLGLRTWLGVRQFSRRGLHRVRMNARLLGATCGLGCKSSA